MQSLVLLSALYRSEPLATWLFPHSLLPHLLSPEGTIHSYLQQTEDNLIASEQGTNFRNQCGLTLSEGLQRKNVC